MTQSGSHRTMGRSITIDTRHHSSVEDQTDGKTILVVEDNEDVGSFLVLILGYRSGAVPALPDCLHAGRAALSG